MTGSGSIRGTRRIAAAAVLMLCVYFVGCTNVFGPNSTSGTPSYPYLTGNWEFTLTATQGPVPFPTLAGFLDEEPAAASATDKLVTLTQLEQPAMCYLGGTILPLQGTVDGTAVSLFSFSFNGQYMSVNGTKNSTGTAFTGTYNIGNGCADGYAGTIAGVRYAALTGTYSGAAAQPTQQIAVTLQQATLGSADGATNVSGTAAFTGISCFSKGTVTGNVLGKQVHLTIATNETGGSQLILAGTFDPAASMLQASSLQVMGGSCAGSLGMATLSH